MTVNKRKKFSRMRGSHTHKWGSKKKHRGQGNRGGRGFAGTGKRADTFKPSIWNDNSFFGKHGFVKKGQKEDICPVSIQYIEEHVDLWVEQKSAEKKEDIYVIDLSKCGFNKLLADGKTSRKYSIVCSYCSKKAIEKIMAAGGNVESKSNPDTEIKTPSIKQEIKKNIKKEIKKSG